MTTRDETAKANLSRAALDTLIDALHGNGRLRVWSLAITVFGDAIVPRGGRVALVTLQELMDRLRVAPGALRTAMSRLAADGWVLREREGRHSFYRLAPQGRHAFDLATRRIYAATPPFWDGEWTAAIAAPGVAIAPELAGAPEFTKVADGVFLTPGSWDGEAPDGVLILTGRHQEIARRLAGFWALDDLAASYRRFIADMAPLDAALQRDRLVGIDALAARTLLVHGWRRLVLRDPGLPAAMLPAGWPGDQARALVARTYRALYPAAEQMLDRHGLPAAEGAERFAQTAAGPFVSRSGR